MNKAIINDEVVIAYDVLKNSEIVENGKIKKTWRGQISTFGAADAGSYLFRHGNYLIIRGTYGRQNGHHSGIYGQWYND